MRETLSQFLKYFWPSNLFKGFGFVISEWHRSDAKNRAVLLAIFTPMIICMAGLLYSFASFIFEVISRLLGWFFLTAIFGGGGIFCYEKLNENRSSFSSRSSQTPPRQTTNTSYDASAQRDGTGGAGGGGASKGSSWKKWF